MRRLAFVPGLLALTLAATLAACGDDSSGGGEEVDGGFDAGPFCRTAGNACDAENPCCSGPCPASGICPNVCAFNAQCETGCCAPDPALGGAPTCQPVDACFDGTQGTTCQLFAEAICAYGRADFAEPTRCEGALFFELGDIANCERDFKRGCCGPDGCDRQSFFGLNEITACLNDIRTLPCPADGLPMMGCGAACYFSDASCAADADCRTCRLDCCEFAEDGSCVDGMMCVFPSTQGTASCNTANGLLAPAWSPPFSCRGIETLGL